MHKKLIFLLLVALALPAIAQSDAATPTPIPAPEIRPATSGRQIYDTSNWLGLVKAAEGGGGIYSNTASQPTAFAGVKLGLPVVLGKFDPKKSLHTFTLDLGYDRVQAHNAFSAEVSALLPVFRHPAPQKDASKNFLRIYAEPGVGYRSGGLVGGYGSAKVMLALFSDQRLDFNKANPFVEIQRRFPFTAPLEGDTRVTFGVMVALCNHCGLD